MLTPNDICLLGFVKHLERYDRLDDTFQRIVRDMCKIIVSPDVTMEEMKMALSTLEDALSGI